MSNEVPVSVRRSANFGNVTIGSAADEVVLAAITSTYRQLIPHNSTDFEVNLPIDVSRVLVSAVHSTKQVTLYTNQHAASTDPLPSQTIVVPEDGTLLYNSARDPAGAKTFTADVTSSIFVTNSNSTDAILEIGIALDRNG